MIRGTGERSEAIFSVRGLTGDTLVYSFGNAGLLRTAQEGGRALIPQGGVCALALAREGRLLASGFTGACRTDRGRLLEEMRIRAAAETAAREKPVPKRETLAPRRETPAPRTETPENVKNQAPRGRALAPRALAPSAETTFRILEMAERLFGAMGGAGVSKPAEDEESGVGNASAEPFSDPSDCPPGADCSASLARPPVLPLPDHSPDDPDRLRRPAENPFPKTFPRSVWRDMGGGALSGEAVKNGRRIEIFALPAPKGAFASPRAGLMTGKDGRRFFVEIREKRQG
jgi:hypothetical protein